MKQFGQSVRLATELGMAMGIMAAAWTLLGLWLGLRLDARLGTQPIATLLLLIAGAAAGQLSIWRLVGLTRPALAPTSRHAMTLQDGWRSVRLALLILVMLVVPILLGLVLGVWLDSFLGTQLVFTLVFSLGCAVAGLYGAIRVARPRPPGGARIGDGGGSGATDHEPS